MKGFLLPLEWHGHDYTKGQNRIVKTLLETRDSAIAHALVSSTISCPTSAKQKKYNVLVSIKWFRVTLPISYKDKSKITIGWLLNSYSERKEGWIQWRWCG